MRSPDNTQTPAATASRREPGAAASRWYQGVTAYQWLVLVIASAGWVFDTFEGQIFNLTRGQMLADVLPASLKPELRVRRAPAPGQGGRY